jgi:negative regulator of flagellin synthesis FlgM
MRVDAYNKIAQVYQASATKTTTKTTSTSSADQVEISRIGKDYQVAKQAVMNTTDVRTDKVNDIKNRMAAGTYNISAEEVASKLVDSYFNQAI